MLANFEIKSLQFSLAAALNSRNKKLVHAIVETHIQWVIRYGQGTLKVQDPVLLGRAANGSYLLAGVFDMPYEPEAFKASPCRATIVAAQLSLFNQYLNKIEGV